MNTACPAPTIIILAVATILVLGVYMTFKPQDPTISQSIATSTPSLPTSTDTTPTVSEYRPDEIPLIPFPSAPAINVFASNTDKTVIQTAPSPLQSAPGIMVSPAKCDGNVLVPGSTVFGSDDSASTSTGSGAIINNGDGAGTIVKGDVSINYGGDGNEACVDNSDAYIHLIVSSDGTGPCRLRTLNISLSSNEGGFCDNPETDETTYIKSDGSGNYKTSNTSIINNSDGSGLYISENLRTTNNGDRTTLVNDVGITDAPRVEPFLTLGKSLSVELLKPVESCGTVITLEDGILFDPGELDIRPDVVHILSKLTTALDGTKILAVHIYGHTGSVSDEAFNQKLSEDRANAVSIELKRGDASTILDTTGCGEPKLVAPNENVDGSDNPAGCALNRCVEIFIPAFQPTPTPVRS